MTRLAWLGAIGGVALALYLGLFPTGDFGCGVPAIDAFFFRSDEDGGGSGFVCKEAGRTRLLWMAVVLVLVVAGLTAARRSLANREPEG